MSYSLNEFEALALKAARGAGLPWGLAEEAGKAVRILSSFGFDAGPVLLEALKAPKHEYNGLMFGPSLCDNPGQLTKLKIDEPLTAPGLLIAFVTLAVATADLCICLKWKHCEVYISKWELYASSIDGFYAREASPVWITTVKAPKGHKQKSYDRAFIADDIYETLNALAAKTYAPATEASRISGAGSGLSDND